MTITVLETPCRVWRGATTPKGYGTVSFGPPKFRSERGKTSGRSTVYLHRWIMEQYLGRKLRRDEVVRHRCDNPPCFRFDHLVLGTYADNTADMMTKGRHRFGTKGTPKFIDEQVAAIRVRLARGERQSSLAKEYGMSQSQMSRIARGESR